MYFDIENCKYCHVNMVGGVKPISVSYYRMRLNLRFGIWKLIVDFMDREDCEQVYDINYCPMCGRKLNEDK